MLDEGLTGRGLPVQQCETQPQFVVHDARNIGERSPSQSRNIGHTDHGLLVWDKKLPPNHLT